jgi:hypothetical protein
MSTNPTIILSTEAFLNWLTDVTAVIPAEFASEIAWQLSVFNIWNSGEEPSGGTETLQQVLTEFWAAYRQSQ